MRTRWELGRLSAALAICCLLAGFAVTGCHGAENNERNTMQLTSTAFKEGESIPAKYTCDGTNVSPPLQWSGVPATAKCLVLIADDPDAPMGTWVHWVVYDLPASASQLPEDVPKGEDVPSGGKQGISGFRKLGYGGPCPPPGNPHRYFFKLYALDAPLGLKPGVTKQEVESAMDKHVLAQGQLMGTYKRK
jgi:hypothetical protein